MVYHQQFLLYFVVLLLTTSSKQSGTLNLIPSTVTEFPVSKILPRSKA
ncbi:MAG: hypothetical protein Q4Q24_00750 [Methanobrevibacter ruminantium]|nr:hypothetical protein [Methanobrevibacter ruminantium]MDD6049359.1 hypothetical protein [Methanobrevibacter ruminantium]MDO5841784.1 hypothetical protein [Methanobrevibacter ruminantium]